MGIFDQQTNVEIKNQLTVFTIRDLEEELRPIAMYLILDYIWTKGPPRPQTPHSYCR